MTSGTANTITTKGRLGLALVPLVAVLAWGTPAGATPEFPGVVVQTLGLSGITIDPPNGCTLCHTTDSGGTSLRPFGLLIQQDGTQPYEDATLEAALGEIAQSEPALVADIKAGSDPNDDPSASSLPTPSYGCVAARAGTGGGGGAFALGALAAFGLMIAIARRRRPASAG